MVVSQGVGIHMTHHWDHGLRFRSGVGTFLNVHLGHIGYKPNTFQVVVRTQRLLLLVRSPGDGWWVLPTPIAGKRARQVATR